MTASMGKMVQSEMTVNHQGQCIVMVLKFIEPSIAYSGSK
jgi:hypothetical protein